MKERLFCECNSLDCMEPLPLTFDEFSEIQARHAKEGRAFIYVVLPTHLDGLTPLETGPGYAVVEEDAEPAQ